MDQAKAMGRVMTYIKWMCLGSKTLYVQ